MASLRSVESLSDLLAWQASLLGATAVTNGDKIVGARLALYRNNETGLIMVRVDPTLMKDTALGRATVKEALGRLVAGGWIDRIERPGRSSKFVLLMQNVPSKASIEGAAGAAPSGGPKTFEGSAPADAGVRPSSPGRPLEQPHNLESNIKGNLVSISPADLDLEFEKWFAVYPRRAGRPEARKEYHRIIRDKLATTEQLTFGAEAYAAERSGQDHTFTKKPAKWLSVEGWLDEPVKRADGPRQQDGPSGHDAVVAVAARRARQIAERASLPAPAASVRTATRAPPRADAERAPPPPAPRIAARPPPPKAPPRPYAKRGQQEMEIREALGADVFDELPEPVIAGLCARWAFGKVPAAELDALRLQHLQARATGPPAAAPTRVAQRRV